jgi:hypothetical protein
VPHSTMPLEVIFTFSSIIIIKFSRTEVCLIIVQIWEGRPIKVYETGEYNLVDGNFSP